MKTVGLWIKRSLLGFGAFMVFMMVVTLVLQATGALDDPAPAPAAHPAVAAAAPRDELFLAARGASAPAQSAPTASATPPIAASPAARAAANHAAVAAAVPVARPPSAAIKEGSRAFAAQSGAGEIAVWRDVETAGRGLDLVFKHTGLVESDPELLDRYVACYIRSGTPILVLETELGGARIAVSDGLQSGCVGYLPAFQISATALNDGRANGEQGSSP